MSTHANVVLVGFMGTGKTTIGKLVATSLHMEFVDMDDIIVQRQQKPISQIFEEEGEAHFRQIERELVKELADKNGLVVGTGGGVVLNPHNISDFERSGRVICLTATPEEILARVQSDTSRPLLAGDNKLGKIKTLLDARQHLYRAMTTQIDTTNLSTAQVVARIVAL